MTITVYEDRIAGARFSLTANGPTATRSFSVTTTAAEAMTEILAHASIPDYFDAHPDTGGTTGYIEIYALEILCEPVQDENSLYSVIVNYSRPDAVEKQAGTTEADALAQVGSSVSADKTQVDKDGAQIVVSLTGQSDQNGDVDIQVPETILLFERKESANPVAKAIANTGAVNSASLATGTYAAKTLLCLGIEGVSTDDGETWQVTYRFQYRPETWDATVVYIDRETDRPHEDINIGTSDGVSYVSIYPEVNFTSLSLPF